MNRGRNNQSSSHTPARGEQADQQRWHAFDAPRRTDWKRLQLPFSIAFLAGLILVILWTSSWLRPPRPTRFLLAGAGYETNLSVPHNALGWNVLVDLQEVSNDAQTQRYWGHRLLRSGDGPQRMQIGWRPNLENIDENNVVLMLTGHGFIGEKGPALLPENVDLSKRPEAINISDVIAELQKLPEQTNKLLIIDSCRTIVAPRLGLLTNNFSDSMRELDAEIRKAPNLTVVIAADVDQRAFSYYQQHRTAMGHYVIEGLRGAITDSDDDGRIDAGELFRYVDSELMQFAAANHNRRQNVMLLPLGDEGTTRADAFDLGVLRPGYEPEKAPTPIPVTEWEWMTEFWQQQTSLAQAKPSVLRFAPHIWRRYQETLLRMESLLIAGDVANASRLRSSASELANALENGRQLPLQSQDLSLSWRAAAGWLQPSPEAVSSAATLLTSTAPQDVRATYDQSAQQQIALGVPEAAFADALRRELLLRAAEDPIRQLNKNWRVIGSIGQSHETGPTELVFVDLLCQQIDMSKLSPADAEAIGRAIKTNLLAEQAAASTALWSTAFSSRVDAADLERRLGQDLLFIDSSTRLKSIGHFETAAKAYASITNDVAILIRAMEARNNALAELPFYNNWTMATPPESGGQGLEIQVMNLWESAHDLDDQMNGAVSATAVTPDMLSTLIGLTTKVEQQRLDLQKQNEQEQTSAFVADPSESLRRLSRAMLLPAADAESRRKLLIACIDATGAEVVRGNQPAPSIEQQEKFAKIDAARAGHLVLSQFGQTWFDQLSGSRDDAYMVTNHRLEVFGVEQIWRQTLADLGADYAQKWRELIQLNTRIDRDDMDLAMIDRVGSQSRIIPADVTAVDNDARDARRATLAEAALLFAGRAWNEHWDDHGQTPYYLRAARLLSSDAIRFGLHPQKMTQEAAPWQQAGDFALTSLAMRNWTTEATEQYHFDLKIVGANPPSGIPRFGFTTNGLLRLAVDDDAMRGIEWTGGTPNGIDVLVEADLSGEKVASNPAELNALIEGTVFFRGHLSTADTKVVIHRRPSNHLVSNPAPDAANLAIVASPELHQQYGSGDAAITIVLDASGSMGAPAGQPFGPQAKYAEAVRALDRLLETIPNGTQVSVWTFGQAMGSQKTVVEAERTIQRLVPPIIWNSKDKSQYQQLTRAITYPQVEPWNESPIMRTMIEAKGDLAGVNGPKTMLVITDGADNRFANDSTVNPTGKSVAEALFDIFDGSGISIQVVGFKVVSAEAALAQKQFELVEQLYPPGGFYMIDRVEALEAHLANVLSRRLTFVTATPQQRQPGPEHPIGDIGGGQIWLTPNLKPGRLAVETPVDPALAPTINLQRGDLMLLQLVSQKDQLSLVTADYLAQRFPTRPTMTTSGWKSALLQNRIDGDKLEMTLGIQQQALQLGDLSVIKPSRIWISVGRPDGQYAASHIVRQNGFPMATYSIAASDWPITGGVATPTVSLWWTVEDDNVGVVLRQTNDYAALEAIQGQTVETSAGQVQILSANVEQTQCLGADGKLATVRRLAIRTQAAPDEIVWCEPIGYQAEGIEIKAFRDIGAATSYFWPLPEGNVDSIVAGLRVVTLKDFQRHAELRGQYLQFNELAPPATRDFAPRPALRLNGDAN
ncbi:hypothetical protein LOC68_15910 [Blastopirellula sp. JC732]|uniref:VWFA domain-containing protein n=1 Tax=Blastopirellula sediminis TaxID=2894196 RepID=A0A9X1SHI9_9BACT|nr:hypothetical protein [Blastopirellula sediminis]MCC9606827.1 hypothetical protein [Blastopirellula sediminis]MCC9629876.1 hypothetical protein [Blastopirellula sediminis]